MKRTRPCEEGQTRKYTGPIPILVPKLLKIALDRTFGMRIIQPRRKKQSGGFARENEPFTTKYDRGFDVKRGRCPEQQWDGIGLNIAIFRSSLEVKNRTLTTEE
jgi:hypothetical protein